MVEISNANQKTSLFFSIRGPIPIQLDDNASSWSTGVSVLDLVFSQSETVSEISFKNSYTAKITLLVRYDDSVSFRPKREHLAWASAAKAVTNNLSLFRSLKLSEHNSSLNSNPGNSQRKEKGKSVSECMDSLKIDTSSTLITDWVVSAYDKIIMRDPHTETGSQDTIVITALESLVPLHDITAMRFILRQPSPNWKQFKIEDIAVYKDSVRAHHLPESKSICHSDHGHNHEMSDLELLRSNTAIALRAVGYYDRHIGDLNDGDPDTPEYEILGFQFSF